VLGVTGVALATGKQLNAVPRESSEVELHGVCMTRPRCVGCRSCEYSCAEENGLPAPPDDIEPIRKTDEVYRTLSMSIIPQKPGLFESPVHALQRSSLRRSLPHPGDAQDQ